MLAMAGVGLVDKIIGGKLGLASSLEHGMAQIGELMIDVTGMYVVSQTVAEKYANKIEAIADKLFFDPSILIGSTMASDMGAYPLCIHVAQSPLLGSYAGTILAGTLGGLISFFIPVYLGCIKKEDNRQMITGFLYGVSVLPVTFFVSGLLYKIPVVFLLKNLLPVLLFCLMLFFLICRSAKTVLLIFQGFGVLIRALLILTFILTMVGLFLPQYQLFEEALVKDTVVMVAKMGITVGGSLVAMECVRRLFKKQLLKMAAWLGVNEWSVLGFLVGMPTGIAILPIYSKMDTRGKILNAAFCVSGHYMLGGQMALIANMETTYHFGIYLFHKLAGAVLAVAFALYMERKKLRKEVAYEENIGNHREYP